MHYKIKFLMAAAVLSSLLLINNCSNEAGPSIGGEAVPLELGSAGEITTRAHETVSKTVSLRLFETAPGDKPSVAVMTLLSSNITISSLPAAASGNGIKAQPANGSATVKFYVAPGQPGFFSSQPASLADYDLKVSQDKITLSHSSSEVPGQALNVLLKNNVNVTMEIKADFDAKLTVKQAALTFGPSAKTVPPASLDEELDNFFNNMDPTPDEPEPSIMADCWQLKFVPLAASDGNVPEDPMYAYYEFNEAGGLQRLWNVIPEDEQLTINESFRFPPLQNVAAFISQSEELVDGESTVQLTRLESRTLPDEEAGTVTFGWLSELKGGIKLNASPDLSSDMRRIQGIKIRDAFLLGDPADSLIGDFELLDKNEIVSGTGDKSEKYKTITGAFTAFKIDCPDPSQPEVFSQEEQVADDSTTTTSAAAATTTVPDQTSLIEKCNALDMITETPHDYIIDDHDRNCYYAYLIAYYGPQELELMIHRIISIERAVNAGTYEYWDHHTLGQPGGSGVSGSYALCEYRANIERTEISRDDSTEYMVVKKIPECESFIQDPAHSGMPTKKITDCPCLSR